jgi:hypothetical protein
MTMTTPVTARLRTSHLVSNNGVLRLYAATIFLSAFLLFSVQPVFAKLVLPKLGGSPSVWAVSMCFFQAVLLAGYCYAHALNRFFSARTASAIHVTVLLLAMLALPFGLPSDANPPAGDAYLWLIGTLAAGVGIPFFAVSANAPLLQSWFARSGHPHAADPYFLYGASNFGSLLALLAYPVILEPAMGLSTQAHAWTASFALLTGLIALSASVMLVLTARAGTASNHAARAPARALTWQDRAVWVALALVPSGLLVAYTTHLTTDIASAPFLWVLPLAAFLATFIFVFRDRPLVPDAMVQAALAPFIALTLFQMSPSLSLMGAVNVLVSAVAFVLATLFCHRQLYLRRPPSEHLTEFYLWMSFGGVAGGMLASLVAPQVFTSVAEYPLFFAAAMACQPGVWRPMTAAQRNDLAGFAFAALLPIAVVGVAMATIYPATPSKEMMALAATLACCFFYFDAKKSLLVCMCVIGVVAILPNGMTSQVAARSFFGVVRVVNMLDGEFRVMIHGTTIHGAERVATAGGVAVKSAPGATYYHPAAPMTQGIEIARTAQAADSKAFSVGIVGLGVGSLSCYAKPGDAWRYYEIDPVVVSLAGDPKYFSFMTRCPPSRGVVLGDARLSMKAEAKGTFDYLVIDAFSSDSVPVHLMTREATELYLDRLKPGGLLAFHVSSRFMDLERVAADTAASIAGVHTAFVKSKVTSDSLDEASSDVVFVSRDKAIIDRVKAMPGTQTGPATAVTPWTDDYSDVLGSIRRRLANSRAVQAK